MKVFMTAFFISMTALTLPHSAFSASSNSNSGNYYNQISGYSTDALKAELNKDYDNVAKECALNALEVGSLFLSVNPIALPTAAEEAGQALASGMTPQKLEQSISPALLEMYKDSACGKAIARVQVVQEVQADKNRPPEFRDYMSVKYMSISTKKIPLRKLTLETIADQPPSGEYIQRVR